MTTQARQRVHFFSLLTEFLLVSDVAPTRLAVEGYTNSRPFGAPGARCHVLHPSEVAPCLLVVYNAHTRLCRLR